MTTTISRVATWFSSIRSTSLSPQVRQNLIIFACFSLFLIYGSFRQRYIWGVDSFGYYQMGKLFSEGRLFMSIEWAGEGQAALAPLGFVLKEPGLAAPTYPPGFSLFIAIGHWLKAPMWVTPFMGVVSCILLYQLLRDRVARSTAWLFTIVWAFMPLTVYGSTMMMSDLIAATTLMGGLLAFRHDRVALAAWIFGLSIAVRPTNVLFFLPFSLILRFDRKTLFFFIHLIAPALVYAAYNWHLYGAPWRTGYGNIIGGLVPGIFPKHFWFFITTCTLVLHPFVIGLAGVSLRNWSREKAFFLLWPLTFVLFYSLWAGGDTSRWWWTRFILPGIPAVFLLAAEGFESAYRWVSQLRSARFGLACRIALVGAIAWLPFSYVRFGRSQHDIWQRDIGVLNYRVVQQISEFAPPGSLIGSVDLASTFKLYSDYTAFLSVNYYAPQLIEEALAQGRRVYLIPEPWFLNSPELKRITERFKLSEVAHSPYLWEGVKTYEVTSR